VARAVQRAVVFAILLAATSFASAQTLNAEIGGAWTGQYAVTDHCDNGTTFSSSGIATASFSQSGSSVTGTITLHNATFSQGGQDCADLANPATITVSIEGTVSGESFTGLLHPIAGGPVPLTGSIDSNSLTLSFPRQPVTSGTFTLARAQTTTADMRGDWAGQYAVTDHCDNGTTFSSNGTATASFSQNGSSVTGTVTLHDVILSRGGQDCADLADPRTITVSIAGTLFGNFFSGLLHPITGGPVPITGLIEPNSLALSFLPHPVTSGTFTLARSAAVDITGSWTGTANSITQCHNGVVRSDFGAFALGLMQQNGRVTGVATIEAIILNTACQVESRRTFRLPAIGTVSGNTLTATVLSPFADVDPKIAITATMNGPTMTLAFTAHETTGSVTLTQTITTTPDSRFAGAWNGNYVSKQGPEDQCPALPAYSGPVSATFFHAGTEISGLITSLDTKHYDPDLNCRLHEHYDVIVFLSGSVSGNTATGPGVVVWANHSAGRDSNPSPITLMLSGDTITATRGDAESSSSETYTLSRNSTASLPIITSFESTAASITAGQSSILRWDTFNATSVTIDNGLGPQGASGSITITPIVMTTYTLTATVSGGTVTAKTTVTVLGGISRRRAVRH
jgi:hypothetical protein